VAFLKVTDLLWWLKEKNRSLKDRILGLAEQSGAELSESKECVMTNN